jgi:hypothetical protein
MFVLTFEPKSLRFRILSAEITFPFGTVAPVLSSATTSADKRFKSVEMPSFFGFGDLRTLLGVLGTSMA